jgi:hypothetical protein
MHALLEQAARVLDHQPTRSMEAEPLYRKALHECGAHMPFPRFVEAARSCPDRFAVIEPDPVAAVARAWDPRHRSLYRAALEAAGLARPVIVLAERMADPPEPGDDVRTGTGTAMDVLGEGYDALIHLLRAAAVEEPLHDAVTDAVHELDALRRALTR